MAILITSLLFVLLELGSTSVLAQIQLTEASREAVAQTAYQVVASVTQGINPTKVEVVYRSGGTGDFRAAPMALYAENRYRGTIPASDVVPPTLEFYVQVTSGDGTTHTDPAQAPGANVYSVAVSQIVAQRKPPSLVDSSPAPNEVVLGRSPAIRVTFAADTAPIMPGRIVAAIDGVDVTAQLEVSEREIRLRPAIPLTPGGHQIALTVIDASGQPFDPIGWSFTVRDFEILR